VSVTLQEVHGMPFPRQPRGVELPSDRRPSLGRDAGDSPRSTSGAPLPQRPVLRAHLSFASGCRGPRPRLVGLLHRKWRPAPVSRQESGGSGGGMLHPWLLPSPEPSTSTRTQPPAAPRRTTRRSIPRTGRRRSRRPS
jgi:hypothetical protein